MRDGLLGTPILDLDISVSNADLAFAEAVASKCNTRVLESSQFSTYKIAAYGTEVDIAMTRSERYDSPAALPSVLPASIGEDLQRRDFSINAIALSLNEDSFGEILDPMGGIGDNDRKIIRVLHPESFRDDPTRAFRAIRYAGRLGFEFEHETLNSLKCSLPYINSLSGDRIRNEMRYMFFEKSATTIMSMARVLNVLEAIYPTLTWPESSIEMPGHTKDDENVLAFVSILSESLDSMDVERFIGRLNMPSNWSKVVLDTQKIKELFEMLKTNSVSNSELFKMMSGLHGASIEGILRHPKYAAIRSKIQFFVDELLDIRIYLTGNDLISLGVREGESVGRMLESLHNARQARSLSFVCYSSRGVVTYMRHKSCYYCQTPVHHIWSLSCSFEP